MPSPHLIGPFVRRFLLEELDADRNLSPHTRSSYRDCLLLLFRFISARHDTDPTRVTVEQVDAELVRAFLHDLEETRGNCVATRNQRLAALRSLFRFIGRCVPELVEHAARIGAIPDRRAPEPMVDYLEKSEVEALLAVPDRSRELGRRNHALLLLLYNTGARASEAARLAVSDLRLDGSPAARFFVKGRKHRLCPLWPRTVESLRSTLGGRLDGPPDAPVFLSQRRAALTRFGVYEVMKSVKDRAAERVPSLRAKRISPHTMRHTTAVHLLQAGVDINTIRAWLGHVSLETTNRYAEVDLEMKKRALQSCAETVVEAPSENTPSWHRDSDLMEFLTSL